MSITQRQLEEILTNEGLVPYDAVEDPEGFDSGKTELAISIATSEINKLIDATGWQPIETAPKDGTRILLYEWTFEIPMLARWNTDGWDIGSGMISYAATHWMPLPEPPQLVDDDPYRRPHY